MADKCDYIGMDRKFTVDFSLTSKHFLQGKIYFLTIFRHINVFNQETSLYY